MALDALVYHAFGFTPMPFYAVSILLHACCTLGVYTLAVLCTADTVTAFAAACFFAVFEGHNEAVMWAAASSDLLVCLFILLCAICWLKWATGRSWLWYAGCTAALLGAAASKESFFVAPPLLLLVSKIKPGVMMRRVLLGLIPLTLLSVGYVTWSYLDRVSQPGYSDIRFSIHAPWVDALANSLWTMLWIWGTAAVGTLFVWRRKDDARTIAYWLLWIVVSLFPNCFLTYMHRVPSRLTYLASVGLAMLAGAAAQRLVNVNKRRLLAMMAAATILINVEIIWVKKMDQFRNRAEPSELLRQLAAKSAGPLEIQCTPLEQLVAAAAVTSVGKQAIFPKGVMESKQHCFAISYTDLAGKRVTINKQMDTKRHGAFY